VNVLIYTDGGCSGNPGPGGWAYVIVPESVGTVINPDTAETVILAEKWGAEGDTTNNKMELLAVISALEALSAIGLIGDIKVFTDSQYVQKGMTVWIKDWKLRNWKTSDKKPVKNQNLWQRLDDLCRHLSVSWHWVKGHAGNFYNERCDKLTQKAIASLTGN